ncbi:hypothetical protein HELRODRAFT_169261 [Helobdella robusta]|uniref:Uncharacterized protein n=1 Tax=Helobdella robusta TaxID=6412 RepID=T1F1N3_HELRO|nr:hypothetical protein HELRODRAFT_169261 [Helobdella robusta]ESO08419.1 hypothetical protein HELRODRAFT_169261 [Helobdella robusta]
MCTPATTQWQSLEMSVEMHSSSKIILDPALPVHTHSLCHVEKKFVEKFNLTMLSEFMKARMIKQRIHVKNLLNVQNLREPVDVCNVANVNLFAIQAVQQYQIMSVLLYVQATMLNGFVTYASRLQQMSSIAIKSDVEVTRNAINSSEARLNKLGGSDLNDKMQSLKHDIKSTFASVVCQEVKKNVDVFNAAVKNLHKTLIEAVDVTDREIKADSVMLFRLPECVNDKDSFFLILNYLTDDAMCDKMFKKM